MNLSYCYRLYPTKAQTQALDFLLLQGRTLYNAVLKQRITVYKRTEKSVNYCQQWEHFRNQRNTSPDTHGYLNATSVPRRLSRSKKGSNRRRKAVSQVARLHERIANQRRDFWHKTTRELVDTYSQIALEDLTLKFMTANHHLALSTYDVGMAEFQQLLAYKAESAGTKVVTVNPAYTSQACSDCGMIVPKDFSIRVHVCPNCGLTLDRDVNAARNILMLAVNSARTGPPGLNVAGFCERPGKLPDLAGRVVKSYPNLRRSECLQ